MAQRRHVSLNQLLDELATQALVEEDAYTRFQWQAGRGSVDEELRLLDQLDRDSSIHETTIAAREFIP